MRKEEYPESRASLIDALEHLGKACEQRSTGHGILCVARIAENGIAFGTWRPGSDMKLSHVIPWRLIKDYTGDLKDLFNDTINRQVAIVIQKITEEALRRKDAEPQGGNGVRLHNDDAAPYGRSAQFEASEARIDGAGDF